MALSGWSTTAASNTSVGGISTDGNVTLVNQIDNMIRGLMAEVAVGIRDGKFIGAAVVTKSGNYTAVAADSGALLHFTAAATLTLTAAATLTSSWAILVRARGGAVTVDPDSAETINGAATLVIPDGKSALIVCNGTAFFTAFDSTPSLKNIARPPTGTYTTPTDVKALWIRAVGAGGGGGGGNTPGGTAAPGGGGGGGAYGEIFITSPAASYAISLGAGGVGAAGIAGTAGTATTVGSVLNVGGGAGGAIAGSATVPQVFGGGQGGGITTGGDRSFNGSPGNPGFKWDANVRAAGQGGDSPFGYSGPAPAANSSASNVAGANGAGKGSGGTGGISSTTTQTAGGNGADGYVEIWEYI